MSAISAWTKEPNSRALLWHPRAAAIEHMFTDHSGSVERMGTPARQKSSKTGAARCRMRDTGGGEERR